MLPGDGTLRGCKPPAVYQFGAATIGEQGHSDLQADSFWCCIPSPPRSCPQKPEFGKHISQLESISQNHRFWECIILPNRKLIGIIWRQKLQVLGPSSFKTQHFQIWPPSCRCLGPRSHPLLPLQRRSVPKLRIQKQQSVFQTPWKLLWKDIVLVRQNILAWYEAENEVWGNT